jgi:hypothetical protein
MDATAVKIELQKEKGCNESDWCSQIQNLDSGEQDIVHIVLLAHHFDKTSYLFNIPKDLIGNILQWYDHTQ